MLNMKTKCLLQYRDLKIFHDEYVGEPFLNAFITYHDKKDFYLIQVFDPRFLLDHKQSMRKQPFEECGAKPHDPHVSARTFAIVMKRRQVTMTSDENTVTQIKAI